MRGKNMTVFEVLDGQAQCLVERARYSCNRNALDRTIVSIDTVLGTIDRFYDEGFITTKERGLVQKKLADAMALIQREC